jgi:hypothetical protein
VGRHKKADKRVVRNTDYDPDVILKVEEESDALKCSFHDLVNDALRYYFDNSAGLDQLTKELKEVKAREEKIQSVINKWRNEPLSTSPQRFIIRDYLAAKINEAQKNNVQLYSFTIFDAEFKRELMAFLKNLEPDGVTALMGFKIARAEWRDLLEEVNDKKAKKI